MKVMAIFFFLSLMLLLLFIIYVIEEIEETITIEFTAYTLLVMNKCVNVFDCYNDTPIQYVESHPSEIETFRSSMFKCEIKNEHHSRWKTTNSQALQTVNIKILIWKSSDKRKWKREREKSKSRFRYFMFFFFSVIYHNEQVLIPQLLSVLMTAKMLNAYLYIL